MGGLRWSLQVSTHLRAGNALCSSLEGARRRRLPPSGPEPTTASPTRRPRPVRGVPALGPAAPRLRRRRPLKLSRLHRPPLPLRPWAPPRVGPESAGGASGARAQGAHFGDPERTEAGELRQGARADLEPGSPRRLPLRGGNFPAPTFGREEAAPPAAPAAAAPHAQRQQQRHPAQPRGPHPRRRCPRAVLAAGARRAAAALLCLRVALRAPPRSASAAALLARRRQPLTGAGPERLRRSPRDGP